MKFITTLSLLFTIIQVLATGGNNGINCSNAISLTTNTNNDYVFGVQQSELYFDFNADNDSLLLIFSENGQGPFAEIYQVHLYEKFACGNLTMVQTDTVNDSTEANYFTLTNLTINGDYLMVVKRDPNAGLPLSHFNLSLPHYIIVGCSLNIPCNNIIENGDFTNTTVSAQNINAIRPFGGSFWSSNPVASQVCGWETIYGTPHVSGINTSSLKATMWVNHSNFMNGYRGESVSAEANVIANTDYVLSFKIKRLGATSPDFFKVKLIKDNQIPSSPTDWYFATNTSVAREIASLSQNQITSSWQTFTFCINVPTAYDRIYFLPHDPSITSGWDQKTLQVDDISFRKISDHSAGNDIILDFSCASTFGSIGSSACETDGLSYSWTPTTGIINPNEAVTQVNDQASGLYTLNISLAGTGCTTSDQVNVTKSYSTLKDGWDLPLGRINTSDIVLNGNTYESNNATFVIEGEFIVDNDWTLTDCNLMFEKDAKLTVTNGAQFIFDGNLNTSIRSCGDFWDGIYADGSSRIQIKHAHPFEFSRDGLVSKDGADLIAEKIDFESNLQCIKVTSDVVPRPTVLQINNSNFNCTTPFQYSNGDYYYPSKALILENSFTTQINSSTHPIYQRINDNTFDGSAGFIDIKRSYLLFHNNVFKNFNHTPGQPNYPSDPAKPNLAISVIGRTTVTEPYGSVVFDNNSFQKTRIAFDVYDNIEIDVTANFMNKDLQGLPVLPEIPGNIFFRCSNNFKPVGATLPYLELLSLGGNELLRVNKGILIYNTDQLPQIGGNEFTGQYGEGSQGILIDNSAMPNKITTWSLTHNSFDQMHKGLEVINGVLGYPNGTTYSIYQSTFEEIESYTPSICSSPPCQEIPGFGVRIFNTDISNKVLSNIFSNSHSTTNDKIEGFVISYSDSKVNCNTFNNLGVGVRLDGLNLGSNRLFNAEFTNCHYGLVYSDQAQYGSIAGPNHGARLSWQHNLPHSGHDIMSINSTNGSLNTLYLDPLISGTPSNSSDASSTPITVSNSAGNVNSCVYPSLRMKTSTNNLSSGRNLFNTKDWSTIIKNRMKSVKDSNHIKYELQIAYLNYVNDTLFKTDSLNRKFGDSLSRLGFGKLLNEKRNSPKNKTKLNRVKVTDQFNRDYQFTSVAHAKLMSKEELTTGDLKRLRKLAWSCPKNKGWAVHVARNVLGQIGEYHFWNECEGAKYSPKAQKRLKLVEDTQSSILIYPNPAKSELNLKLLVEEDQTLICFYNVLGSLVYCERLNIGNIHKIPISQLNKGLYIYRISVDGEILKQGKQIIE